MKKLILSTLILLFSSLGLAAPAWEDLLGNWQKDCRDLEGDFLVVQIKVEKKSSKYLWTDTQIAYEDDQCVSAYLKFEMNYAPSLSANNIDLVLTDVAYTPLTNEVGEALNSMEFCGISNWQMNKRQSILDKACDGVGNYSSGQKLYSIVKTAPASLFVGMPDDTFDGTTSAKRHLQYEPTAYRKLK